MKPMPISTKGNETVELAGGQEVMQVPAESAETWQVLDREALGKQVRSVWIKWAREQSSPKPSWLLSWDELTEPDKEVDRRIGETLWAEALRAFSYNHDDPFRGRDLNALEAKVAVLDELPDRFHSALKFRYAEGRPEVEETWRVFVTCLSDEKRTEIKTMQAALDMAESELHKTGQLALVAALDRDKAEAALDDARAVLEQISDWGGLTWEKYAVKYKLHPTSDITDHAVTGTPPRLARAALARLDSAKEPNDTEVVREVWAKVPPGTRFKGTGTLDVQEPTQ